MIENMFLIDTLVPGIAKKYSTIALKVMNKYIFTFKNF